MPVKRHTNRIEKSQIQIFHYECFMKTFWKQDCKGDRKISLWQNRGKLPLKGLWNSMCGCKATDSVVCNLVWQNVNLRIYCFLNYCCYEYFPIFFKSSVKEIKTQLVLLLHVGLMMSLKDITKKKVGNQFFLQIKDTGLRNYFWATQK